MAPLLLAGAGIGVYLTVGSRFPRDHEVILDLGRGAITVTELELSWTNPRSPSDEAALVTRWHFAPGTAPERLHARVRLADGDWDAEIAIERAGQSETTHWSSRVNLTGTPWWKRDNVEETPLVLKVREALR